MTEAPDPLDAALAEFATAEAAAPQPQYPSAAERLTEIERLKQSSDEWRRGIEAQLDVVWPAVEALDEIRSEEELKSRIADARQRHRLNGHTPDSLVEKLVGDEDALKVLAQQDHKLADAEASHATRRDIESAMLAVRGVTHARSAAPEYSPAQLMAMSEREWTNYKAQKYGEAGGDR